MQNPSVKLSLSKYKKANSYKIKNLNIYSVEEAIYIFYNDWKSYYNYFFNQDFIKWVYEELLDNDLGDRLSEINNQDSFYQKSIEFLTLNDFYLFDEIEKIASDLYNWEKRQQISEFKALGDKYFEENLFKKAIKVYLNALDYEMNNPFLYNNIGVCYMRLQIYDEAINYLKKAFEIGNKNQDIIFNIIECSLLKDDFELCEHFISYIDQSLNMEKVYYYKGERDFFQGEYNLATANYIKSYFIKKSDKTMFKIALGYYHLGDFKKVDNCLKELEGKSYEILIEKSNLYEKIGSIDSAIKNIEDKKMHHSERYDLWLRLAMLYRSKKEYNKAQMAIDKAKNISPENKEVLFEEANIKKEQGNFESFKGNIFKIIKKSILEYKKS